jgi:hypothetical protein
MQNPGLLNFDQDDEGEYDIDEQIYNPAENYQQENSESESVDTQQKDIPKVEEERKEVNPSSFEQEGYYSDSNASDDKYRMISEMNSEVDHDFFDYNILTMEQKGVIVDKLPIRTGWFNRGYMAIGTNSKCLKIWDISAILTQLEKPNELDEQYVGEEKQEIHGIFDIPVIFDQLNHHEGSIYCIDWTECERLIATGSNDKKIKILVWPPLDEIDEGEESDNLLELTLNGHQAIVRSLWFHPKNELNLISGGDGDSCLKVWDTEKGDNVLNLDGHSNGVAFIKPNFDGSFFASVGKDTW